MFNKTTTPRVTCALRSLHLKSDDQPCSAPLSPPGCSIAFQRRIIFYPKNPPAVPGNEQSPCPLPFNSHFENFDSSLDQLLNCSWFSDAWHWCPFCQNPQELIAREPCSDHHLKTSPSKKPLRLKRAAISFFKQFGRKSSVGNETSSLPLHDSPCYRMCVLESHRHYYPSSPNWQHATCDHSPVPEMAADSVTDSSWEFPELEDPKPYEMAADNCQDDIVAGSLELYGCPPSYEMAIDGYQNDVNIESRKLEVVELGDGQPDHELAQSSVIPEVDQISASMASLSQPSCSTHILTDWPNPCGLESPYSEKFPAQGMKIETAGFKIAFESRANACIQGRDCAYKAIDEAQTLPVQNKDVSDLLPSALYFKRSSTVGTGISTEALVENMLRHVCILENIWAHRLSSLFTPSLIRSRFYQRSIFETGSEALQQFCRGILPRTFHNTFALIHVAFACAFEYQHDVEPRFRNTLFQDALRWRNAIATAEERDLFLKVALWIWSSPGDGSFMPNMMTQDFVLGLPSLWDSLSKGAVISACTPFLDSIEYAGILERNDAQIIQLPRAVQDMRIQDMKIQDVQRDIINNLPPWNDCRDIVHEARLWLHQGILLNLREFEVKINEHLRSSQIPRPMYNLYRNTLASLCDNAMQQQNSNWRNPSYVTHVDKVLAVFIELQNTWSSAQSRVSHETPIDSPFSFDQQSESPISMKSSHSSISTHSSATTMTCSAFRSMSNSSSNSGNTTLTFDTTPSVSPVELPSPDSSTLQSPTSEFSISCNLCGTSFSGKPQDQRSNLKRHMRHVHGNSTKVFCPECNMSFTRRDNLSTHCRRFHGYP